MWTCENGHADDWTSSKVLCEKRGQKVFVNTLLMAASILITGNNFEKVRTLFTFLGTGFLSASTFHRIQRNYVVPEVSSLWEEMKKEIWAVLNNETLILCGDGRSDSPGFSAKYGTYLLMEQFLEVIVDLEVIDKRQTGGVSTNMEVAGLKMLLERIVGNLVVSEVVTDASTAVMALVRRMKGNYKQM
jgi:solute carrier family 8 (sodium/calcium exchanger)